MEFFSKLVEKFMKIGRIDIVITYIRSSLQQPGALSVGDRKKLAYTLFKCFLLRSMMTLKSLNDTNEDTSKGDNVTLYEKEFRKFLKTNQDYDPERAMNALLQYSFIR